jgi:2-keto-4-pentenoate hydratase/2-oxohepta-3-ene-1,7-dioic acid hydratase in catechol pathway
MSNLRILNSNKVIPVQNIFCAGRNYVDHISELDTPGKKTDIPKEPVIFLKPNSAIVRDFDYIKIPEFKGKKISADLQNEVELVVVIGKDGNNISEEAAMSFVHGYAVGIDFTLRDLQSDAKKTGMPWAISKGFFTSAPVSDVVLKKEIPDPAKLDIKLSINGEVKQNANTSQMIFSIKHIIHYISTIFGLRTGDIIFTGTPAGITTLKPGDIVEAAIEKIGKLTVRIGE